MGPGRVPNGAVRHVPRSGPLFAEALLPHHLAEVRSRSPIQERPPIDGTGRLLDSGQGSRTLGLRPYDPPHKHPLGQASPSLPPYTRARVTYALVRARTRGAM